MKRVTRTFTVGLIVTAAVLTVPSSAGAAPPRIVTSHVDVSVTDSYFTHFRVARVTARTMRSQVSARPLGVR